MPELPEVETLRRELQKAVSGKIIKSVEVKWPKMIKPLSAALFKKKLIGNRIIGAKRRAKMLLLQLAKCDVKSPDCFLGIHLKMTGQLVYRKSTKTSTCVYLRRQAGRQKHKNTLVVGGHPQKGGSDKLPNKHTHIIVCFTDGSVLYFNDSRKFGWMRIISPNDLEKLNRDYGVEALSPKFNAKKLTELIKKYPNRKIKQLLLDQTLIAGIGNIYADESCFCAGILPTRLNNKIAQSEIAKLVGCIKKILKLAISKGGTSADTYVQLTGKLGGFVPYLKVYGRKGEQCKRCKGVVEKIKLNGRGTHFCRNCQK